MGTTHIEFKHISHPPSLTSEDDELHDTGVQVSPHVSPEYSDRTSRSRAGSSELRGEYVHLRFPNEIHDPDVHPSDSASILNAAQRPSAQNSRPASAHRSLHRVRTEPREADGHRLRGPAGDTESLASTEEYLARPAFDPAMRRGQSYFGNNGAYTHSTSSGSYNYPPQPGQVIQYAPPQQLPLPLPVPYQYQQMASPSPMYAPTHHGYPPPMGHHPGSHVSSPYSMSAYQPSMMGYPAPGYFPPQYPQPYPHPQYMDPWTAQSPALPVASPPPSAAPTSEPEKLKADPDEIAKRIEAIMLAQSARESEERIKRDEARSLAERAAADDLAAKAERQASDRRIREEAHAAAMKAAADAAAAEADRARREQRIREEAAAAALKSAADEAAAKAERAAKEAKIAAEAASAAKIEAEKKAADEAAKAKEASEAKQKEAEKKLKDAEEAAAKAKAEAEEATKRAEAAAPPPEKKAPIRFHDAVGRKFNFPFELCTRWRGMESLIIQAFRHIEDIGEQVQQGRYDLVGPSGEVILPQLWESLIEPDWIVTMHMWPPPEPPKEEDGPIPPPPDGFGGMLDMDAILNGPKKGKEKPSKGAPKRSRSRPGGFSMWMMGGPPKGGKPLKGDKKPEDVAGVSQHGAPDPGGCTVM